MHSFPGSQAVGRSVVALCATPARTALSHSNIVSRKHVQPVECQTDLAWVSLDNPIQSLSISGRPGLASASTQASSGSTGPTSADTQVLCESAAEKSSKGSAER